MEVMQTVVAPYLPGLLIFGALLFLVGLVVRLMGDTEELIFRGNTAMRFGVLAMLIALALWALLWVMEAWASGVIDAWIESWQKKGAQYSDTDKTWCALAPTRESTPLGRGICEGIYLDVSG